MAEGNKGFHPIRNWVDSRVMNVLNDLNLNINHGTTLLFDKDFDMLQNKVQYQCDTRELLRFYKTRRPKNYLYSTNLFYRVVQGNIPILHYPLGHIITKTMVNLLFSDNPVVEMENEEKMKLLEEILKENDEGDLLQKACEFESYSGAVAFKPVLDPEFSEFPILVPYPKEDIELVEKYGKITEVIFKDRYEKENDIYHLYTICGKGYIDYKLYMEDAKKKEMVEMKLETIPETSKLHRIDFMFRDGTPYSRMTCVYKENRANAESDYRNLIDDFAALDEVYSNMIDFIRRSRVKTYIPESLLDENVETGKKTPQGAYDESDVVLHDSNPTGTTQEVKRDIVDVNASIQGYKDSFNNILLNALSTAGLSPCSVGLDLAGANSSALALNIRERVSLRTRAEKLKRWEEALKKLFRLVIELYGMNVVDNIAYIDPFDDDIKVLFPEYETPTFAEQVTSLKEALDAGLVSRELALKQLYPNYSDEQIAQLLLDIRGDTEFLIETMNNNMEGGEDGSDSEDKDSE